MEEGHHVLRRGNSLILGILCEITTKDDNESEGHLSGGRTRDQGETEAAIGKKLDGKETASKTGDGFLWGTTPDGTGRIVEK